MTKKDYELLARAFKTAHLIQGAASDRERRRDAILDAVLLVSNALETDNPRFDRHKFLKACGF